MARRLQVIAQCVERMAIREHLDDFDVGNEPNEANPGSSESEFPVETYLTESDLNDLLVFILLFLCCFGAWHILSET